MVQRRVGVLDECLRVLSVAREGDDANAERRGQLMAAQHDGLGQIVKQSLRDASCIQRIGEIGQQHGELVTAQASHRVVLRFVPEFGRQRDVGLR